MGALDVGVSWRGDGKYVATCVRCGEEDLCPGRVRIWDVESLTLHAIGEQSPGTLPVLAWQPNGRTLCVANCLSDAQVEEMAMLRLKRRDAGGQGQAPEVRHVGAWKRELRRRQEAADGESAGPSRVFIYERNGLQHGDFAVPGDGLRIEQMAWSGDSRTLAVVVCEEGERHGEHQETRSVQIWCRSNWKWYNKWTRTFGCGEKVLMAWHEGPGGPALTTWTTKSLGAAWVISSSKLAWDYDVSDYGTVAVISGERLMVTPMRQCMIPPPLCAVELLCGRPISCVLFSRMEDGREVIGTLLDDGRLAVATCPSADDWESLMDGDVDHGDGEKNGAAEDGTVSNRVVMPVIFDGVGNHQFRHAAFLGTNHVVFVGQDASGVDSLFQYRFATPADGSDRELHFENCVELEACVSRLVRSGESTVFFELEDGRCRTYTVDGAAGTVGTVESVSGFGVRCDVVRIASLSCGTDEETTLGGYGGFGGDCPAQDVQRLCALGLDQASGRLFRNGVLLASDATSMGIHARSAGGPHLLYSTRTNLLKTLPLFGEDKDAMIRPIEDGCVLVSLPETSVEVVMQAPRGNLEIIRPRSLVLPAVHGALDRLDYSAAWRLATINRVDMNDLVNYGWPKLLDNVRAFIDGVGRDTEVAGFLQSLEVPPASADSDDGPVSHKRARLLEVCKAFRDEVSGQRAWLRTELTSRTKCGEIGKALLRVKEVKEMDMNNSTNDDGEMPDHPSAEVGLKHVLLHNPENKVYEAALGEYELQLSYMVVAHIQRDPGEYLAQLQEFTVIENQHMRMAAIDKHLGRFDKAVQNLFDAGSFDDALELASSKGLLKHLLALVDSSVGADPNVSQKRHVVLKALGDQLSTGGKYEDAALAYIAAGDLEQALRSYRLASAWRPAMTLAARLGKDAAYVKDLARRLCDDLEQFQPVEAARINLEYLGNLPAAVRQFAQGGAWREALRLAVGNRQVHLVGEVRGSDSPRDSQSDGTDALMEVLVSVASESASRLLEGFVEDADRVEKYWSRLRDLRDKRVAMDVLESERDAGALDDDAFIDTASVATDMSMFSMLTDATATSTSTFASFASTVGGRRSGKRQPKKKSKIRRGSPEEEDQLTRHLLTLLPKANICEECGQLTEFLVYIGHEDDAVRLQASLKGLIDRATAAADDVLAFPPPGRKMFLPYAVREGIFDEAGPATLLRVDHHVASVADAELQVQVQEGKTAMSQTGWKWEMLRRT